MKHIIPTDLINRVLSYLATKAYSEVATMIRDIQSQAKPHVEPDAPAAKVEEKPCDAPSSSQQPS